MRLLQKIDEAISTSLIIAVRGYQKSLGSLIGGRCRYLPTCSDYFIGAVEKYGAFKGGIKGVWRILRCHPFAKGGFDPY